MKKFKSLVLIQIKDLFYNVQGTLNIKNKKLAFILQLFLLGAILAPAVYFSWVTYQAFAQLNQPELVITTMYVNSSIIMFFLGIPIIISVFFFSKDIQFLSALPIEEEKIVFGKLSTVYIYLLAISAAFVLPSILIYAVRSGFSLSIILFGPIAFLLAPLLPLLISSFLVLLFNKLIRKSKYKNILTMVGNLVMIAVIIIIQMGITQQAADPEIITNAYLNNESLINFIGVRFPPSIWLTKMVLGSVTNTIYFIGVNFLFVLLLYFTAKYFFKKALLTFVEGERNRGDIYYQKKNRGVQLFKRHIMIIVKEPTFLLNALLSMVVPLIIYVVMSFSGQFSLDLLRSEQVKPFIGLIYSGIIIFPAIVSNISSTAITREGQAFWQTKVLPISSQMNMRYRILTTLVINLTGTLLLGIIGYILLPVTLQMVLIGAIFAVATNLFLAVIDFTINVYRPLLNWSHPTAAVKNNMNVTMALGIRLVIGLILFGIYKIAGAWMTNYSLVLIVLSIVFLGLYFINRFILYNKLVTRFNKIAA